MEREKHTPQLPYGVPPIVRNFLLDCINHDVVSVLDTAAIKAKNFIPTRHRNIIGVYYGSDARITHLAKIYNISTTRISELIKEGMIKMWSALPAEIQSKYNQIEILESKAKPDSKTVQKGTAPLKGRPSPHRGVKFSEERKRQMSGITNKMWESSEHREKIAEINSRPETIEARIRISTQNWQNPEYRESVAIGWSNRRSIKEQREQREPVLIKPREKPKKKVQPKKEKTVEKPKIIGNGGICVSDAVLRSSVEDFIKKQKKAKKSATVDDVVEYLQNMGISFDLKTVLEMLN